MKIETELIAPKYFHETLHQQIPSTIKDNKLIFDKEFGVGGMTYLQIQKGLYVNLINAKLNEPLTLCRTAKKVNDYFILNFHLSHSNIIQKTTNKEYQLGFENTNIVLSSACTEATIVIPNNVAVKIFNIGFTIEWLEENIFSSMSNSILSLFRTDKPIYLFETMNFHHKKKVKLIDFENQTRLSISSGTLQLLDYFFQEIAKRNINENRYQNMNHHELSMMLKVSEQIENSFDNTISVENLAKMAGMSLSKFKLLFQQLFGTTPYKYYLANRMSKSMELLELNKYSVTEVSYIVGYSNPSQFSKAFQNHFGILPSEVK